MDSPERMFSQISAEAGVSNHKAKQALYLLGLSQQGRSVEYAAKALRRKPAVVKKLAREFMIDMADYRPFAKRRDRGEEVEARFNLGISNA